MSAANNASKVDWAVKKMMELAEEGDAKGIERINDYGYGFARGSNARKDTLRAGYNAAIAKLEQK